MKIADSIKQAVIMRSAAEYYGFSVHRGEYITCPFHQGDRSPSLKLYPDDGGWHCFGCNKGGSVIDFVMLLFDLNYKQAVLRINSDFHLGLMEEKAAHSVYSKALEERRKERCAAEQEEAQWRAMVRELWYWREVRQRAEPVRQGDLLWFHPLYVEAVKRIPAIEAWLDERFQEGAERDWIKYRNTPKTTS